MTLLTFDRILDYINIICLTINVLAIFYINYFSYKFKVKTNIRLLEHGTRRFLDGILAIELLFLFALYAWVFTPADETLGGIADPSLLLYIIAEHVKSFYFMSVIFLTWKDVKIDATHILDAKRDRVDGL